MAVTELELGFAQQWTPHEQIGSPDVLPTDYNESDLTVERFEPDDIMLLRTRIEFDKESLDTVQAKIIAEETLLKIMLEFFADGEDFHIHNNPELRDFVKDCMRQQIIAQGGDDKAFSAMVTDSWLEDRFSGVRGFPPHSYNDDFAGIE